MAMASCSSCRERTYRTRRKDTNQPTNQPTSSRRLIVEIVRAFVPASDNNSLLCNPAAP